MFCDRKQKNLSNWVKLPARALENLMVLNVQNTEDITG